MIFLPSFHTTVKNIFIVIVYNCQQRLRTVKRYSIESLIIAQRLHMRGSNNSNANRIGEMQGQHLKLYMAFLLQDHDFNTADLSEIFTLCWPT